jgi:enoyl-[acyl-carrier-protein] reductase (NADH)
LAVDFGADNIRVNAIVPGAIRTGTSALQKTGAAEMYVAKIPISRRGEPDEIAGMAILLASPSGAYITGQSIVIDGGSLLKGMEGITEGYDFAAAQWAADKEKAAEAAGFYALTPKADDGSG